MPQPNPTGDTEDLNDELASNDTAEAAQYETEPVVEVEAKDASPELGVVEEVTETEAIVTSPASQESSSTEQSAKQASTVDRPHKSKGWLVAVLLLAILALSVCGVIVWYFAYYSNPDKVAYDAIHNLITADNVGLDGGLVMSNENAQLILDFDSSTTNLPNATAVKLVINQTNDDLEDPAQLKLNLGSITMRDGVIYLQADGILDSLKTMGFEETDESTALIVDYLEEFESGWWQISVPEITEGLELGEFGDLVNDAYMCVVEAADQDNSDELAKIYNQNRFIQIEPVKVAKENTIINSPEPGYRFYEVSVDQQKLKDFSKAFSDSKAVKNLSDCFNHVSKEYLGSSTEIDINDIDFDVSGLEDFDVYMEISNFGHQLRSIRSVKDQDADIIPLSTAIIFKYGAAPEIKAPSDYRSILELIEEIATDIYEGDLEMDFDDIDLDGLDDLDIELDDITTEV